MIVTLAILSLMSVILFQSVTVQWSAMQRVSAAFDRAGAERVRETTFRQVLHGLVPAWPEQPRRGFRGDERGFSSVTDQPLTGTVSGLHPLTVSAEAETLRLQVRDQAVILASGRPAYFAYRGLNGDWYKSWPPESNPGNGFFQDGDYFDTPALPESVRVTFGGDETKQWVVHVGSSAGLPFRIQDVQ